MTVPLCLLTCAVDLLFLFRKLEALPSDPEILLAPARQNPK